MTLEGILKAEGGNWQELMGNLFGRRGLFSAYHAWTDTLSEGEHQRPSKQRFELKRRRDWEEAVQKLMCNPEPENYLQGFRMYYGVEAALQKRGSVISVRLTGERIPDALKLLSPTFLLAGYTISFKYCVHKG